MATCCAFTVAAVPLRVCVPDTPIPPFIGGGPQALGETERALSAAGTVSGFDVTFVHAPPARCLQLLERREVDGSLAAPTTSNLEIARFPMKSGQVDASLRLVHARIVFAVLAGRSIDWDGRRFAGVDAKTVRIGARKQLSGVLEPLRLHGLEASEQPTTARQLLDMLVRGRVDVVASLEEELRFELGKRRDAGIRVLSKPLMEVDYFLGVSPAMLASHRDAMQRLWETSAANAAAASRAR